MRSSITILLAARRRIAERSCWP